MESRDSLGLTEAELTVDDIMTEAIVVATPEETVLSATQRMSEHNISCIAVVDGERPVGILTERDVLRGVAAGCDEFVGATVGERMSSPLVVVPPDLSALEAGSIMEWKDIKRLLVVRSERLLGVVTQTNITESLISMCRFSNVSELMTNEVVTVNPTTTVTEAAQLMASRDISCVVLWHRDEAAGIVTEKDILQRVVARGGDPNMPAAEIMSFPVVQVPPTYSVMSASRKMYEMHIHRLLVGSGKDMKGIITQTDIIAAVRRKLEEAREARVRRQSEISRLLDLATKKLLSIQGLSGGSGAPADSPRQRPPTLAGSPAGEELQTLMAELQDSLAKIMTINEDAD
jgi:CBS domain-containing protein